MNNEKQKEINKKYFIDALCEIIKNDGMKNATIRNVAQKAGYNSATIYNYFENFSHLLMHAHFKFEDELMIEMQKNAIFNNNESIFDSWVKGYLVMTDYYLSNPNIFDCIFVSKYENGVSEELRKMHQNNSKFIEYVRSTLKNISDATGLPFKKVTDINESCLAIVIGKVLLQTKDREHKNKQTVIEELRLQIKLIIQSNFKIIKEVINE